jgi:hypothetical protein
MTSPSNDPIWSPSAQLAWLEGLSSENLKDWLRRLLWARSAYPLVIPSQAMAITYLADVMGKGSPKLTSTVREVVPNLLQEWGRNDPTQCLDNLLVLCGLLRCASAEPIIAAIIRERLASRPDEIELRKRCFSVLGGFGCSEHTAPLFYRYLEDIDYSAYCFRALYKYDLNSAVTTLPTVVTVHKASGRLEALKGVLDFLFFDYLNRRQRVALWRDIIKSTKPEKLEEMLRTLQSVDIVLSAPVDESQDIEVIYNYSLGEPRTAGEKVEFKDFRVAEVAAINRALEDFLRSSNRMAQAVGAPS